MADVTRLRRWARVIRSTMLRLWAQYPRLGLALRTAVAAATAWFAAQFFAPARPYAYYGPLGAVVAGAIGAMPSLRDAVRAVAAIVLGAVLAIAADAVAAPSVLTVAAVVFVGMLLAGWRRLGPVGAWVPTAGVFVLVIGAKDPMRYVATYAGLTALGGAVATALGLLFPQLPYRPADRAVAVVRLTLVQQLRALAEGLDGEGAPSREEWEERLQPLRPLIARMRDRLQTASQAQRWNVRAMRVRGDLRALARQGRALERAADLTQDVIDILISDEHSDATKPALGRTLRPQVAESMRSTAEVLLSLWGGRGTDDASRKAEASLTRLAERVHHESQAAPEPGLRAAATIVHDLERILRELRPST